MFVKWCSGGSRKPSGCGLVPGRHLVLFVLFGRRVVIGWVLPHNMCHSHVKCRVGWECNMTSQQRWLLHDGIVMTSMGMGIPVTKHPIKIRKQWVRKQWIQSLQTDTIRHSLKSIIGAACSRTRGQNSISDRYQSVAASNLRQKGESERAEREGRGADTSSCGAIALQRKCDTFPSSLKGQGSCHWPAGERRVVSDHWWAVLMWSEHKHDHHTVSVPSPPAPRFSMIIIITTIYTGLVYLYSYSYCKSLRCIYICMSSSVYMALR